MLSGSEIMVLIVVVVSFAALVGVVVVGAIAFDRSTRRSDVHRSSVDDPGLDRRPNEQES